MTDELAARRAQRNAAKESTLMSVILCGCGCHEWIVLLDGQMLCCDCDHINTRLHCIYNPPA